jgi:hypothetical protein
MKGTTKDQNLFSEVKPGLASLNFTVAELCNVTNDEPSSMFGTNCGFVGIFNRGYPTSDNNKKPSPPQLNMYIKSTTCFGFIKPLSSASFNKT